jgi:alkanesulfonate monooxygenase SsuD/methylene tetrahydromethanopterin reductase-like flavin-dependent oxidoreductase (luciferase family)
VSDHQGGARIGVLFRTGWPPESLPAFARAMEAAGLDEIWVAEDCFFAGAMSQAATALAVTQQVGVGIGLVPVAVRNVAIATMEVATLARIHPGRLSVGLGHGVDAWMRQIDARPRDRLVALAEVVDAMSRLLRGETVTLAGAFVSMDRVALADPPKILPPILIGTTGERGLRLSGKIADGFVLPEGSGPPAVRWATEVAGEPEVAVVYAWLSIDDDRDRAAAALSTDVDAWRATDLYPRLMESAEIGPGSGPLPPARVREMAVAGNPRDCAAMIDELAEAGASSVVLLPRIDDHEAQLSRLARDVLPRLRRRSATRRSRP